MTDLELKKLVKSIVEQANELKNQHTSETHAPVNYACVFAHSDSDYNELMATAQKIGKIVKNSSTGNLYHIGDLETVAGILRIVKIRLPDKTRQELGDADFTVSDFASFKQKFLARPGFKLIQRPDMEMIELMEPGCSVRVYFSNPPIDRQILG